VNGNIDFEEIADGARSWLASVSSPAGELTGRWKYNAHMLRDWGVEPSTSAIGVLLELGDIPKWSREERDRVVNEIRSWQEAETGLFKDPLISPEDRVAENHSWEHIWLHHTGCCVGVLKRLGAEPLHPLPQKAFVEVKGAENTDWVLELDWKNPWGAGEHFMRVLDAYRKRAGLEGSASDEVVDAAFGRLESEIFDPESGLPDRLSERDPPTAMAGLFKLIFAYDLVERPLPRAERALDSVLGMQEERGGFGQDNLCIHWDALLVVKRLNEQLEGAHRFDAVTAAGLRASEFLCDVHLRDDGGFSFHSDHCIAVHNSVRVSEPLLESDVIGTSMSLRCLRYAREWAEGLVRAPAPAGWGETEAR
jgi:hypothetical protein